LRPTLSEVISRFSWAFSILFSGSDLCTRIWLSEIIRRKLNRNISSKVIGKCWIVLVQPSSVELRWMELLVRNSYVVAQHDNRRKHLSRSWTR
jgi:hypothetical protein